MFLSNSEKMKNADNEAIFIRGVDSLRLMENAAAHVAERAYEYLKNGGTAWSFCGSGNNGGDGIAAALLLREKGVDVRVFLVGSRERMTKDCAEMARRLQEKGVVLEDFNPETELMPELSGAGVIIDAMFGIGLNKPLREKAAAAVKLINASGVPVIAADIPSGIEADTGRVLGCAVKAAETVTFSLGKPGHFSQPGNIHTGRLHIVDIGIPADIIRKAIIPVRALTDREMRLPKREPLSHKGDFGKVLIIGGCEDYCGAPNMCSNAAVRAGAGLVYLGVPEGIHGICAVKNTEAMPFALTQDEQGRLSAKAWKRIEEKLKICSVCVMGPGMGRSEEVAELVRKTVLSFEGTLVLDADALWALGQDMSILEKAKAKIVLTPHDGEFARMGGVLSGDRVGDALSFAKKHNVCILLKGHRSIAAFPDGEAFICTHGNPGMAKGGSGDVLAGILAAFCGQFEFRWAVCAGMHLHALAGDMCRDKLGEYSMAAGDIINMLPEASMKMMEEVR